MTEGSRVAKLSPLESRKVCGSIMGYGCGMEVRAPHTPYCVEEIVQDWMRQVCQGRPSGKNMEKDEMENQSTLEDELQTSHVRVKHSETLWNIILHRVCVSGYELGFHFAPNEKGASILWHMRFYLWLCSKVSCRPPQKLSGNVTYFAILWLNDTFSKNIQN